MGWVAYTPYEGRWSFTLSSTPDCAKEKLLAASEEGLVLSIPVNNPISAVLANEYDYAFCRKRRNA